jgi:hypothetical protein
VSIGNAHSNANSYTYCDADSYGDTNSDFTTTDTNWHSYCNRYRYTNSNGYCNRYRYTNSNGYCNRYRYTNSNSYCESVAWECLLSAIDGKP